MSLDYGRLVLMAYSATLFMGGVLGYTNAKSFVSFIAGAGSAIFILCAYHLSRSKPQAGFGLGTVLASLMAINFFMRWQKSGNFMPMGLLMIISVIAAVLVGITLANANKIKI